MVDKLMTAADTGEALGMGTGLVVSGGAGSKVLSVVPSPDYIGLSLTTVVGESIAAGDVVGAFRLGVRKGYGIMTGSTEITTVNEAVTGVAICALSTTLFVKLYIKGADSKLYAQAFKVDANAWTITEGAEVKVADYVIHALSAKIRMVSATVFVASWVKNVDTHAYCIGGSVDATPTITLSVGGEVEWHNAVTASGVGYTGYDFRLTTTNTLLWAFRDGGDSSYGHCVMGTLAGTAVTVDTAHEAKFSGTAAADDIAIAVYSATRAEVFYESGGSNFANILVKIATTTPTFGTAYVQAMTSVNAADAEGVATNYRGAVAMGHAALYLTVGHTYGYASELTYFSPGTGVVSLTTGSTAAFIRMINPYMGIVVYNDATNSTMSAYFEKIGCGGLNWYSQGPTAIHAVAGRGLFAVDISTDKKIMAVFFQDAADATKGHLLLYDVGVPIGIAQKANSGGAALDICIWGMSDVQTGLTKDLMQYATIAGALTTVPNGFPVGYAYSTTQILMEKSLCAAFV